MKYTHIFFDLDHTLWDYEANARKVLSDLYHEFELNQHLDADVERFLQKFIQTNDILWAKYNVGEIGRDDIRLSRFKNLLTALNGTADLDHMKMSEYFLYHCPRQSKIMDGADMILDYLSKRYHLSIITNGFDDVQSVKLNACGLDKYFSHVFTSESTGFKKPSREIFDHAVATVNASHDKCLMIGDNPNTDILGAQNSGITPVLYNPTGKIKSTCPIQIEHLSELMRLL